MILAEARSPPRGKGSRRSYQEEEKERSVADFSRGQLCARLVSIKKNFEMLSGKKNLIWWKIFFPSLLFSLKKRK